MPVSEMSNVPAITAEVARLRPKRIIECGIGFGKWGVLVREVLEAVKGRCQEESWITYMVGIEGFEAYRNPAWSMYNGVMIGDFTKLFRDLTSRGFTYDLALVIDSLEHLPEEDGAKFLQHLLRYCKNVIVSCPDGDYPQGAVNGNEYERHRARWSYQKFAEVVKRPVKILHQEVCIVVSIKGDL